MGGSFGKILILSFEDGEEHIFNRLLSYANEEIEVLKHDDFCKEKLHFEGLCIDKYKRIVVRDENEIELTYTEFEILLLLAQNAGIVFSKEQIFIPSTIYHISYMSFTIPVMTRKIGIESTISQMIPPKNILINTGSPQHTAAIITAPKELS